MSHNNTKKISKIIGLSVFFLLIIIYAFFGSDSLIFGVKIKNVNIIDGTKINENVLEITGNAEDAINLTLNGRKILINERGDFKETFVLFSGYNVINIKAEDKFGYIDEKNYKLIY